VKPADLAQWVLLAAIWGASFLFMRVAAPEFGAWALAALRVGGAALMLLPFVWLAGHAGALRLHWKAVAVVGCLNSAIPFVLYNVASLSITAGLAAILNATTPLWGALVAWVLLGDRPGRWRAIGLAVGFIGVVWLAWDEAEFTSTHGRLATGWAVLACLGATFCYGLAANLTQRHLAAAPPLANAAGSQVASTLALTAPAAATWPAAGPSSPAWAAAAALAFLCSGVAYLLYFRLIARMGPARAITVTYLIPVFAVVWGALFLDETLTATMAGACLIIFVGTALASGLLPWRR